MYLISYASDRARMRGPFVAFVFVISMTGWLILLNELHNQRARYFGCICIVIGGYNSIPLCVSPRPNPTARRELTCRRRRTGS